MRARVSRLVAAAICVCGACRGRGGDATDRANAHGGGGQLVVDTVATGLEVPWGIAFAPDGRMFVTERAGRIRVIANGRLEPEPWATLDVTTRGETGLMGIAIAPDFAETGELFVVATFNAPRGESLVNRVVRLREVDGRGADPTIILDAMPAARFHAGGAIAFGPDGLLHVTAGDARDPGLAQDDRSLGGKILRLTRDGRVPADNPVPRSYVYAKGVRNAQGLAWLGTPAELFATDHGPSGMPNEVFRQGRDEINVIRPGGNYGWPVAVGSAAERGMVPPLVVWDDPGIAPSGVAAYAGAHAEWQRSLFVAALKGRHLRRLVTSAGNAAGDGAGEARIERDEQLLADTYGRLRAVALGPDGAIYVSTSNRDGRGTPGPRDDLVLRIRPAEAARSGQPSTPGVP